MKRFIALIWVAVLMLALTGCSLEKGQAASGIESLSKEDSASKLDKEMEQFLFGTWKVETFLGFQAITKEDIEWPDGEKIIGKSVIINNELFSSKDFGTKYEKYASEVVNPIYSVRETLSGDDFFYEYRISPDQTKIDSADTVQIVKTNSSDDLSEGLELIIVNNSRLIIMLNCDFFELTKI